MARIPLKDICRKITDGSHNPPAGVSYSQYLMISSKNVEDDNISFDEPRYLSESDFEIENRRTCIEPDDLLLTIVGTIGRVAVVPQGIPNFCLQRSVCVLKLKSAIAYPPYLMYQIQSMRKLLEQEAHGVAQKGIYLRQVEQLPVYIPCMTEQIYIASIFKKISDLIFLRKQQLAKLDELVKARFVEMFGDPVQNDRKWPLVSLKDIAEIRIGPFGTMLHKEDYIECGHALVNPSHIVDGKICIDPKLTISDAKYGELASYALQVGDVILGRRGEMGRCAVVYEDGLLCGTGSMIIRPNGKMLPYFLQNILSNPTYRRTIEDKAVGVTMMNLNIPIVSELPVPLLPLKLQEEFIGFLAKIDKSKLTIQQSLDKLEVLKKALMQEYFGLPGCSNK